MGFVSLHLQKASANRDAALTAHIERTVHPKNADGHRTHLNRELLTFPEGVTNRTSAIKHRIENAGITRKIGKNQVRAICVILTGTHEDMKRIEQSGRLGDWCDENIDWLRKTFGADNLVSAVLHMDEKSPHIHATIVPIVSGERRKAKQTKPVEGKKAYRKKSTDTIRLCADDVMNREKLKEYQGSYAGQMQPFGLQRGIKGSEARHIETGEHYRELFIENEHLKEANKELDQKKIQANEQVRYIYDMKDEAREKFLSMDNHVRQKDKELAVVETKLLQAQQKYEPYKAQEELNKIHELFPMMKEQLRIADLCQKIGLAFDAIKALFEGRILTAKSHSFFSPEHNQTFKAEDIHLKIEKEPDNPNKLCLNINGMNILDWFKQKFQEIQLNLKQKNKANNRIKLSQKISYKR